MRANRPSATALLVALSVLRRGDQAGLPDLARDFAEQALQAAAGGWRWLARLARLRPGRWLLDGVEACLQRGLSDHHVARKRWLGERLLSQPTPRRWLWLGVGFDAQGLALQQQLRGIELIELDHPNTLLHRQKLPAYRHSGGARQALPLRLPQQAETLQRCCAAAPSTLIVEGVLMYLPGRDCLRQLRQFSRLADPPRLLISVLAAEQANGDALQANSRLQRRWLARRGESFRWRLDQARMADLLARHGYRIEACWRPSGGEYLLDARFVAPRPQPIAMP